MLRPTKVARKPSPVRRDDGEYEMSRPPRTAGGAGPFRGLRPDELEAHWDHEQKEGRGFRNCMMFLFFLFVVLLLFLKWDKEHMVPDIEEKEPLPEDQTEKYYSMLNVRKNDKDRGQKIEEQFKKMSEEMEKDPEACGSECSQKLVQLKDAYNALSTNVANPYHKVLNIPRMAGFNTIKKAYQAEKEKAEKGESKYELAELKEAYDIMSHPDARAHYQLYGTKPPASLKHQQRTTHGGWGVEMGMGTFKYVVMKAILDYFNNGWVEIGFFSLIFLMMGIKIWNNRHELMEKMEQMEATERMCQEASARR
eukprot:NODE_1021_length_1150_cov_101.646685_g780_i0.p1 GENE.NODE_1021_length_1150_cov_101.646685_g780_i0~~NODE_1021_length_1150_cov_101.646685_g780_i0.p1  ORF type:complete len:335 (-),score=95.84 NODE_1021_length_1150_cov_101.646685_g780_i0:145-1071(-)